MCGIVGYVGKQEPVNILVAGLEKLEYRGYDSVGISLNIKDQIITTKNKGRIADMLDKIDLTHYHGAIAGIGHTRWATHGEPSDINSHPHGSPRLSIVHNGIIENYADIKERMIAKGYEFESETDTEVVAKCLDYYYQQEHDPLDAIIKLIATIEGSYALGIMFNDFPDRIYATRKDSPLLVGLGESENFIASDMTALLKHTRKYYLIEPNEIVVLKQDSAVIVNLDKEAIDKPIQVADWDEQTAEKEGHPHFMLKEILEQEAAFRKTLNPRIKDGKISFDFEGLSNEVLLKANKFHIVACGTAMHAGLVAKAMIEKFAHVPADVWVASEFRYQEPLLQTNDIVMIASQSGETADSLAALRLAKEKGIFTIAMVNVAGSSIAREADVVLMTHAGIEIAVASTKAYFVQIALFTALAIHLATIKGQISEAEAKGKLSELLSIEQHIQPTLDQKDVIQYMASLYQNARSLFFIGRGFDYIVAMEGSLKLKEISYIHSEAYPAGELKHGTISLITDDVPVIALATQTNVIEKTISNIKEVKARGAHVLLLKRKSTSVAADVADETINLPDLPDWCMPFVSVIILQLFAYYMAVLRGCDVDKPRNLAKSVTVE